MSYLLNVMARVLGFILRPNHDLGRPFKTIAVAKYKGMGSIVMATPLLKALRVTYPEAQIVCITSKSNRALLSKLPFVDDILEVDDRSGWRLLASTMSLIRKTWKAKIGVLIDLEIYSNYSSVITTLTCAKNRLGYYKSDRDYRKGMYTHMMYYSITAPLTQVYLQIGRLLPLTKDDFPLYHFEEDRAVQKRALAILSELGIDESNPYLVINPNTSDLRPERNWPLSNFAKAIDQLSVQFPDYHWLFIGGPGEEAHVQEVIDQMKRTEKAHSIAGKTTIPELIEVLRNARLMISNDTGPMHLASTMEVPIIGLFGPNLPELAGTAPSVTPIYENVYCSPCVHEFMTPPCNGDNQCMKQISVDRVVKVAEEILTGNPVSIQKPGISYSGNGTLGRVTR